MLKKFAIAFLAWFLIPDVQAQSYQKTELGVKSVINSVAIEIQFYSPSTVRVLKWPDSKFLKKESLSVIKIPQKTDFSVSQQGDGIMLKSEKFQVFVNLN